MVFGFLKKDSKKKEFEGSNEDFWTSCIILVMYDVGTETEHYAISAPYNDLKNKLNDQSFLKNVIKKDKDVHRKTAAAFYLFQNHTSKITLNEFFNNTCNELDLNLTEIKEFSDDINAVVNVMKKNNLVEMLM